MNSLSFVLKPDWGQTLTGIAMRAIYLLLLVLVSSDVRAQPITFQYLYDHRNQLSRVIDSTGIVIEYIYDPVGNILEVKRSTLANTGALTILSFSPQQAGSGAIVTIQGLNFSTTPAANVVRFNGVAGTILSATINTLIVALPLGVTSGPVTVTVGGVTVTAAGNFSAVPVPVITSISPKAGVPGSTIPLTVTGVNLTGAMFSFAPQFSPPAIVISGVSINAGGTSATMSLAIGANALGTLVLAATTALGTTDPFPSAANAFGLLNPLDDEDRDGLKNGQEATFGTNPFNPDTDGDIYLDGVEVEAGSDPLNPASTPASINPFREAVGFIFSQLNAGDPSTISNGDPTAAIREAMSASFSMLNTGDPGTAPSGADPSASFHEALSLIFSMQNLATVNVNSLSSSAEPSSARLRQPPAPGRASTAPRLALVSAAATSLLYEGQTLTLKAVPAESSTIERVEIFVNGALISVLREQPFEALFTVPSGVEELVFSGLITAFNRRRTPTEPVAVRVSPDPRTMVEGRLLNADGSPAPRAEVVLEPSGLQVGFYPLDAAGANAEDLRTSPALSSKLVSAINLRNPNGVFGSDPLGAGAGPVYIARFHGQLWIREGGRFEFVLGADSEARLMVNGVSLLERRDGAKGFEERTAALDLPPGLVPIEIIQFRNQGHGELQLSYTPAGGVRQVIPPEALLAGTFGPPVSTGASGTFLFHAVPAIADTVRVRAQAADSNEESRAISGRVPLVRNAPTDLGTIFLTQGVQP